MNYLVVVIINFMLGPFHRLDEECSYIEIG